MNQSLPDMLDRRLAFVGCLTSFASRAIQVFAEHDKKVQAEKMLQMIKDKATGALNA